MRKWYIVALVFVAGTVVAQCERATERITFSGTATGGELTLTDMPMRNLNSPYTLLRTSSGESASVVAADLATAISNDVVAFEQLGYPQVDGCSIFLPSLQVGSHEFMLGGTESGLGIPPPPTSVSVSYDPTQTKVFLRWVNPPVDYDFVIIGHDGNTISKEPGSATEFTTQIIGGAGREFFKLNDMSYIVIGWKGGVPSNGAGISLTNQHAQISLMNIPFAQGLAPNFKPWSLNTGGDAIKCEEGRLPGVEPGANLRALAGKGFFQVVKGSGNFAGGVWRRFLGLIPGHTYKVSCRLNTMAMGGGAWSLSFHAAYDNGGDLSVGQMAGAVALPDGTVGPSAGQLARYDSAVTTGGGWALRSTDQAGPGKVIGNIALPEGVTSLTVWLRHVGENLTSTGVGMEEVIVEDVTQN